MLYDPKWEVKSKPDIYSLDGLIEWLEKQPPEKGYDYNRCNGTCLLDLYLTAATGHPSLPSVRHWQTCGGPDGYVAIARAGPWTFGAALERARAAL